MQCVDILRSGSAISSQEFRGFPQALYHSGWLQGENTLVEPHLSRSNLLGSQLVQPLRVAKGVPAKQSARDEAGATFSFWLNSMSFGALKFVQFVGAWEMIDGAICGSDSSGAPIVTGAARSQGWVTS